MKLDYQDFDKCIVCMKKEATSFEHVLPQSIGGSFQISMLCSSCNNNLGSKLVSQFQSDPSIRLAITYLRDCIPKIYNKYKNGQYFIGQDKEKNIVKLQYKNNSLKVMTEKREDGSIIYDTQDTPKHLKKMLEKQGLSKDEIEDKMKYFHELDKNGKFKLADNLVIGKNSIKSISLDLSGNLIDKKLIILIAFEYLALLVGTEIYRDIFDEIREYILEKRDDTNLKVEDLRTKQYRPYHKLYPTIKKDHIVVNIVLFGNLVYKVKFNKMTARINDFVYIEDLENEKSYLAESVENAENGLFYEFE